MHGLSTTPAPSGRTARISLLGIFFLLAGSPGLVAQVFIEAAEVGQGILRERAGACYVVTPEHVVEFAFDIQVTGERRIEAPARFEVAYPGDVAILRITGEGVFSCQETTWPDAGGLSAELSRATDGVIETRSPDGSLRRTFVRIQSFDPLYIEVLPLDPGQPLQRGMSGGLLRVEGRPAGMLQLVDPDDGSGVVLRMDQLANTVRSFFVDEDASGDPTAPVVDPDDFRAMVMDAVTLRQLPDPLGTSLGSLRPGQILRVSGRVRDRLWYRVELSSGQTGYLPTASLRRM